MYLTFGICIDRMVFLFELNSTCFVNRAVCSNMLGIIVLVNYRADDSSPRIVLFNSSLLMEGGEK